MKNAIFFLTFFILSAINLNAQINNIIKGLSRSKVSCTELQTWVQEIEKEYPNTDLDRLRSGSKVYDNIRFNLLSDKYFVPVFEDSYTDFSPRKRQGLQDKIIHCNNKDSKNQYLKRLKFYLWGTFTEGRVYDKTVSEVNAVNASRNELDETVGNLRSDQNNLTLNELASYESRTESKFANLLPSEIENYESLLNSSEHFAVYNDLQSKLDAMANEPNSLSKLNSLKEFTSSKDYYSISDLDKTKSATIESRTKNVLNETALHLLSEEDKQFNQVRNDFFKLNEFYRNFHEKFNQYNYTLLGISPLLEAYYDKVLKQKQLLANQQEAKIKQDILSSTDLNQVKSVIQEYSLDLRRNDDASKNLLALAETHQKDISILEAHKQLEREQAAKQLIESKISMDGLYYKELIANIYSGNFTQIPFNRDEMFFASLMDAYITTYSTHCKDYLPANKKQLTYEECDAWTVTKNGYGMTVNSTCNRWRTVETGFYTSPELFYARAVAKQHLALEAYKSVFKMVISKDIGEVTGLLSDSEKIASDMYSLIKMNGCSNPEIKRFEENLRLFALNKQPIKLEGTFVEKSETNLLLDGQNFEKLVDHLIYSDSKKWAFNKYISGGVSVSYVDEENKKVSEIKASYYYNGFSGKSKGTVRITFTDGLPECLYFFDAPMSCKSADRKIVVKYSNGDYKNF